MRNLLIVAPNWLGDAVMALPAIADVRRESPGVAITVAARPSIAPLFAIEKGVGSLFLDAALQKKTPDPFFDAALLLPNSFRSAMEVYRAGIPERWGYRADCRGPLLTRAVDRPPAGVHQIEYYQMLVHALGFGNGPMEPRLDLPAEARAKGADLLSRAGWDGRTPLVGFAPGAAYGGAKRWPPEYFAELARALASDGVATVIVGSAADAPPAALFNGIANVFDVVGKTDLPALAGVLAHCRTLVTNDSGAMHLAAALGVRVTAAFGPTDERVTGPRGDARAAVPHAILTHPVWCRPCLLRECPIDHRCMRGITSAAVAAEVRRCL